jgi:transcription antitermination factor NusG
MIVCPESARAHLEEHDPRSAWFAVRVRSNHERIAAAVLSGKGFPTFLPCYHGRRLPSRRSKQIEIPLFPGYLFSRFDPEDRLPVLVTPGLVSIVSFGRVPAPIPESQINAIRTMIDSSLPVQPWPFLQIGQRVRVHAGPLLGLEGFVLSIRKDCRLVISIDLLQRSVAAEIDRDWIHPIS